MDPTTDPGTAAEIPGLAYRQFERFDGVPLHVISELFARAKIPTEFQSAFWLACMNKTVEKLRNAEVYDVTTDKQGNTTVTVASPPPGASVTFQSARDDISNAQVAELKRAQSSSLCVTVEYQPDGKGGWIVNTVSVHKCSKLY